MQIKIETGSRLHLGFMDLSGDLGRIFGSIGVSLRNPNVLAVIKKDRQFQIIGENKEDILCFVKKFSQYFDIEPTVTINVERSIPKHIGLGSGTQLALAIAYSLARLYGIDSDIRKLASVMGRGQRSGIGVASFENGGFIIDAGQINNDKSPNISAPNVIFRRDFPENWCFVVVVPVVAKGFSGEREKEALSCLDPPGNIAGEICRLVQMKLLPALVEEDIKTFGSALTDIDKKTGSYFKKAQGGIYKDTSAEKIIDYMVGAGAYGAGQSSWGPALYGLVEMDKASLLVDKMNAFLRKEKNKGNVFVSYASNNGVSISVSK